VECNRHFIQVAIHTFYSFAPSLYLLLLDYSRDRLESFKKKQIMMTPTNVPVFIQYEYNVYVCMIVSGMYAYARMGIEPERA
jgi:hypothetical protein